MKTPVHYLPATMLAPPNPITVNLIGAGGTGSQVLTALARMNLSMYELGHPGFQVTVWDDDVITGANLGRQLFAKSELGLAKAVALINRTNRFFGTNWKANISKYTPKRIAGASLTISCVDTVSARLDIAKTLRSAVRQYGEYHRDCPKYWLDFGNDQFTGQVILATVGTLKQPKSKKYRPVGSLPFVTDLYGEELAKGEATTNTPSCSLAEALEKQDLFINSTLANMGSSLLWSLFRNGMTENRGFFLNLSDFRTQPLKVA
ncbi:PRTRC system ThiF family protein [Tellurirhabdus bombi]|uniref:PRTRC system ThiF family protein n=1 Tax=Tellurirhabdus bombi TaxID=2907205 RepID=UPI001F184504|nr:PRTRC system ThiF family protein [Tellurirhabdus bombi]